MLDGISSGIFGAIALVIVSDLATGTGRFNFLVGVLGLSVGVGSSLGNIIAGCITQLFGFHLGFFSLACLATIGL
ncbi:hypothetical protein B6N58_06080 [Legionella micdadei]|uniref:Uncharacterized protein n=1 Tax=Legionella micdadei TaxID=451 RepID=A0A098GH10_LEGMI|nr:hypothetical protein [Legionella micdadei]ARG97262.1 hypothetical protein B6N58_06080 [Legionella micdadei]ARH00433.1 hypothetical protein B6V88_08350 [Legionella micdadei]CEG61280.1 membrane protein of unknown function [Legionella micdadei]